MRSPIRILPAGLLLLALVSPLGCRQRHGAPAAVEPGPRERSAAAAAETPTGPKEALVQDERYVNVIRPLLHQLRCDANDCHGAFKGGGLFFASGNPRYLRDYETVVERIDRKNPKESVLLRKALGQLQHNGGRNFAEDSCAARRLLAWIGGQPDPDCPPPEPPRSKERFAREVVPALQSLGCATQACHGGAGPAAAKLDLAAVVAGPQAAEQVYRAVERTGLNTYTVWTSPVLRAAWGEDGKHKQVDLMSCAYRRLHGYLAGSPESTCDLAREQSWRPSLKDFGDVVMGALSRRGCTGTACHGGGAGDMALFQPNGDHHVIVHDYLAITSRVEDPRRLAESTFIRTVRNDEPHGGGKRLGGAGDCVDDITMRWLRGERVSPCPPPRPPSFERFVREIQPVLDKMTCTQAYCHGESIPVFKLIKAPDAEGLRANYKSVLTQIDYDFMPLSGVQLRMREPCAYSVVGAWIESKPKPNCVVHDPDPSIFPKIDKRGNVLHPKVEPGPPPSKT